MAELGRHHPLVRRIRKLRRDRAARETERVFLAEGIHLAQEAMATGADVERAIVSPALDAHPEGASVLARLRRAGIEIDRATDALLATLQDARSPQPVLLVVRRRSPAAPDPSVGPAVVACDVQDPGNVGGILRTAVAAGASSVIAAGASADPYHPRAVRASAGAVFVLPPDADDDPVRVVTRLRDGGFTTVAAVARGTTSYDRLDWRRPVALVLGSEGQGLPADVLERADETVSVPMAGGVESLSVGAAAAVLLFESWRQRNERGTPSGG